MTKKEAREIMDARSRVKRSIENGTGMGTMGDILGHMMAIKAPPKPEKKKWMGSPIDKCQLCEGDIGAVFYDFSVPTYGGSWGIGCDSCFKSTGGRLGTGAGQKYDSKTMEKLAG